MIAGKSPAINDPTNLSSTQEDLREEISTQEIAADAIIRIALGSGTAAEEEGGIRVLP